MKKIFLFLNLIALTLFSCSEGDPYNGQGIVPQTAGTSDFKVITVASAEYDNVFNELYIAWDESIRMDQNFLGTEFTYTTLSGKKITVEMLRDLNFLQAYNRSTVVTKDPKNISYRSIWKGVDGEKKYSDYGNTESLEYESINIGDKTFKIMQIPEFENLNVVVGTPESDLYISVVTDDLEKHYTPMLRRICGAMWFNSSDPYRKINTLQCKFEVITGALSGAPAYVTADGAGAAVYVLNSTYVKGLVSGAFDASRDEINGIGYHELTHVMQIAFLSTTDNGCFVEGGADASRLLCGGFSEAQRLSRSKSAVALAEDNPDPTKPAHPWLNSYSDSGFFMVWLRRYDGDFWRKFNLSTQILGNQWTFEAATKLILGADADLRTLWREYKEDVESEVLN